MTLALPREQTRNNVAEMHFVPEQIPEALHFAVWRQASEYGTLVDSLQRDWRFGGRTSSWYADGLLFTHARCSATRYQRTPQHIRRGDGDCIVLKLQLSGVQKGVFGDSTHYDSPPGSVVLQDWAIPYTVVTTPYEVLSVAIPRHLLRGSQLMHRRSPVITWPAGSPQARLLAPLLTQVCDNLEHANPQEASTYAAGLTGLLDGLLTSDQSLLRHKYHEQDRLEAMRQYLSQNLAVPDLNVGHLCARFHCSRATVYRLFREDGGIAAFILRQRLQRCLQEITRMPRAQKGFLEALAKSWGFPNRASLARHFKAHFGVTPQEAMEAARWPQGAHPQPLERRGYWRDARRVADWLSAMGKHRGN